MKFLHLAAMGALWLFCALMSVSANQAIEPQNFGPPALYPDSAKDRLYRLPWLPGKAFLAHDGYRPEPGSSHHPDYSIDFGLPRNEPICAARGGVVGLVYNRETLCNVGYQGNTVEIYHNNDSIPDSTRPTGMRRVRVVDRYYHVSKDPPVKVGDTVKQGQIIAYSNCTGIDGGTPHLHFRVHVDSIPGLWRHLGWYSSDPTYKFASIPTPFVEVTFHPNGLAEQGDYLVSRNTLVSAEEARSLSIIKPSLRALPNPYVPAMAIRMDLPSPASVRLDLFSPDGSRIRTLAKKDLGAGVHAFQWDGMDSQGRPAGKGIYLLRGRAGTETLSRRLVLIR